MEEAPGDIFDINRVLRRTLLLRDAGELGDGREWLHLLGLSRLAWAVALTAIQRGIQKSCGGVFTLSFDNSTPLLWSGKYQRYAVPPELTSDISSWQLSNRPFPVGFGAATLRAKEPFPAGSPLSKRLTLGDINPKTDPYVAQTVGAFGQHAISNHNLYVFLRAFIDANQLVFGEHPVPQQIADLVGIIGELFTTERWMDLLVGQRSRLGTRGRRPPAAPNGDTSRKQERRM